MSTAHRRIPSKTTSLLACALQRKGRAFAPGAFASSKGVSDPAHETQGKARGDPSSRSCESAPEYDAMRWRRCTRDILLESHVAKTGKNSCICCPGYGCPCRWFCLLPRIVAIGIIERSMYSRIIAPCNLWWQRRSSRASGRSLTVFPTANSILV